MIWYYSHSMIDESHEAATFGRVPVPGSRVRTKCLQVTSRIVKVLLGVLWLLLVNDSVYCSKSYGYCKWILRLLTQNVLLWVLRLSLVKTLSIDSMYCSKSYGCHSWMLRLLTQCSAPSRMVNASECLFCWLNALLQVLWLSGVTLSND